MSASAPAQAPSAHRGPSRAPGAAAAPRWLMPTALAVALLAIAKPPAIDEESYLWIGQHLDPARPYDWSRVWPPFDATDAYVYAHPPLHLLQMALVAPVTEHGAVWLARLLVGLPWVALLGWSVARLCGMLTHHPGLAAAAWISCSVVVLGLQDSLMIDLPATALLTFSLAAYRSGLEDGASPRWFPAAGVALGAALATKYTMGIVLPVLALHMARRGARWSLLLPAAAIFLAVEGWLWAAYGRPHLAEVWARRGEIESGALDARGVGTLVRMSLLPLSLPLLVSAPVVTAAGSALGIGLLALARPEGQSALRVGVLLVLAALGGALLVRGAVAPFRGALRRRKGDRDDALLLGGWLVAGVLGVVLLHNYASARYLLPVAAPAAILLARSAEEVRHGKRSLQVGIGVSAVAALGLAGADYAYVRSSAHVARLAIEEAARQLPGSAVSAAERRFAGEWSFRWAMERATDENGASLGWERYRPDEVLPSGSVVVVADNASPGAVDRAALEPVGRVQSRSEFPVRVVDLRRDVCLYAETLGVLPFGWARGHLEGATVYRTR